MTIEDEYQGGQGAENAPVPLAGLSRKEGENAPNPEVSLSGGLDQSQPEDADGFSGEVPALPLENSCGTESPVSDRASSGKTPDEDSSIFGLAPRKPAPEPQNVPIGSSPEPSHVPSDTQESAGLHGSQDEAAPLPPLSCALSIPEDAGYAAVGQENSFAGATPGQGKGRRLLGIRFRKTGQIYFFPDQEHTVRRGTKVLVELEQGPALGHI